MAYVARFSKQAPPRLSSLLPARGDKWYIDPEDVRQYDTPFHVKWGMSFPFCKGPNASYKPYLFDDNPYPRMPFVHRQLRDNTKKWDWGDGQRRNMGETCHIHEDWLLPQGGEWYKNEGQSNTWLGMVEFAMLFGICWSLYQFIDWADKKYAIQLAAPKVYPFENLWVEQGGNNQIPKEQRPYVQRRIPLVHMENSFQQ